MLIFTLGRAPVPPLLGRWCCWDVADPRPSSSRELMLFATDAEPTPVHPHLGSVVVTPDRPSSSWPRASSHWTPSRAEPSRPRPVPPRLGSPYCRDPSSLFIPLHPGRRADPGVPTVGTPSRPSPPWARPSSPWTPTRPRPCSRPSSPRE